MGNRSSQNGNVMLVVAALILGASVVAAAVLIQTSIDNAAGQIAAVGKAVAAIPAAAPAGRAAAPSRGGRPDPSKKYKINTAGSPGKGGPVSAPVTVVEFSDFQCPFCSRVTPTLNQIEKTYGKDVRIVFKHLPLQMHSKAPAAHAAAEAAHRQGKFWEMHDKIFANQRELTEAKYAEYAAELGLDVEKFKKDSASADVKKKVDADAKEAAALGVTGTPGFFINGLFLSGARPFDSFKAVIDKELKAG
ncbi:MAG: thioredoxin domain-containing protein [Deltaproteobacteria bacterium]|nr:thioredoxin domain-containing protein [Deltaproteobacteria bacterium]MBW2399507.1 thioredoxin domain-containing protein [Deltaproteobacteria bacterium]MBW2665240.1 thioredoxin domain-containing protein [Deltaproteobacteria bacterium]